MSSKEEKNTPEQSKEDEAMERLAKYSMGCSGVMIVLVTILVILLFWYLN